jgi:hypothetical protein
LSTFSHLTAADFAAVAELPGQLQQSDFGTNDLLVLGHLSARTWD